MISQKFMDLMNEQINHEIYSSYLYLSMSAYFHTASLPGFAQWMMVQSQEEYGHGMKFFRHIIERGG